MKKNTWIRYISIGGLLVSLTVLFQSAPLFLPFIGMVLSPFSTLPIAIASTIHLFLGLMVFITSVLLLLFISTQEAIIFLFTTGLLGITLGTLLYRKGIVVTILTSTIALSIGIMLLTYVVSIPAFHNFTEDIQIPIIFLLYFAFSIVYVTIWALMFQRFSRDMNKIMKAYE